MYSLCTYLSAAVITVTHIYTCILYYAYSYSVAQYSQWKYMVYSITLPLPFPEKFFEEFRELIYLKIVYKEKKSRSLSEDCSVVKSLRIFIGKNKL